MLHERRASDRQLRLRTAYWLIIVSVLAACVALRNADPGFMARIRLLGFDLLQQVAPRTSDAEYPVRIIDIDEPSLKAFGNWPWRRDLLARLIDKLFDLGVRAIAFDMVFPDASVSPLDQIPESLRGSVEFRPILDRLAEAVSPDQMFAQAMRGRPVILGTIGTSQISGGAPQAKASFATIGNGVAALVLGFSGATRNLAMLETAAVGVGALNWFPDHDQIVRRIPMVVRLSNELYPSLVSETLRVAKDARTIGVRAVDAAITTVAIGETVVPTDAEGQLWLAFSRHDPKRTLSAADVLQNKTPASDLEGRIAIVGTSAAGLLDLRATPLDAVISGAEINAQALEQLLANRHLVRPDYAMGMEIALTLVSALLLSLMVYRWGARVAAFAGFITVCVFAFGSVFAFSRGILLDAAFPILTNTAAYIFGTSYLFYEAESERNRGREALQRIALEMETAAQIQRTFLPTEIPAGPHAGKFDIFAVMIPAKSVGGDFYDYFLINDKKLGVAVGDVSGKGVAAALFMSVARTVLRTVAFEDEEPGQVLSKVNVILSRDNSEGMFVTIFYAVLDLETGALSFSSAGHDDAMLLGASDKYETLHYMGSAIGLFDVSQYPTAKRTLTPGDTVLLWTDGITEAFNIDGHVFGAERLVNFVSRRQFADARDMVQGIENEVSRFAHGTEQSDDITCVAMRFRS
jgi:adenylate cyclase